MRRPDNWRILCVKLVLPSNFTRTSNIGTTRLLLLPIVGFSRISSYSTDSVLHFWCGGGYLLNALVCGDKYGVNSNPKYRDHAQSTFGFRVAPNFDGFKNLDVVISSHTLARLPNPLQTLRDAYNALRDGGTLVVLVPCYNHRVKYTEFNTEQHLFSWSPSDIGNLVHRAGFSIVSVETINYRIPPKGALLLKYGGERFFHLACRINGWLRRGQTQVRVVASKMRAPAGAECEGERPD